MFGVAHTYNRGKKKNNNKIEEPKRERKRYMEKNNCLVMSIYIQ